MTTSDAEMNAVALMTSAAADDDACAALAALLALTDIDERVLVSFCLIEACWSWAPRTAASTHPVLGPVLEALRAGDDHAVRSILIAAMTGKTSGSYAALLVQLAYAAVNVVPDIGDRLTARGLRIAADPASAAQRPAGGGR